jgi:SAM-dependent methyltransferase
MPEAPRARAAAAGHEASSVTDFPDEWYALASAGHFWLQWRCRAALRQAAAVGLNAQAPLRVLDVGGGTGVLREQLEARTAWEIDITDLHPSAVSQARRGRGRNLQYDVHEERADMVGAYDVVLLFDVLEHVEGPVSFLAALFRHLRAGGHLLVNVPALPVLFSGYDVAAGHLRRYDPATLRADVESGGFDVRDVRYWGLSLVPLLFARKALLRGRAGPEVIREGFQPPRPWVNRGLISLMRAETALFARPPLGTSLLAAARKRD